MKTTVTSVETLFAEYNSRYSWMPISRDVVANYVAKSANPSVDGLYDYAGSQGLYEEGAEAEW